MAPASAGCGTHAFGWGRHKEAASNLGRFRDPGGAPGSLSGRADVRIGEQRNRVSRDRPHGAVVLACSVGERVEGERLDDTGQDQLGHEQRQEPVCGLPPALASSGQVLDADDDVQALATGLADDRGQGDRGGVVGVVQGERQVRAAWLAFWSKSGYTTGLFREYCRISGTLGLVTTVSTVPSYRPRLADRLIRELAEAFPAVLVNGPRATGKTTTARQIAAAEVRLDQPAQAAAFRADPDSALRDRPEPLLLDEWQEVPDVLGAVKRAVDDDPRPGRFILTGSVRNDLETKMWPGTGRLQRVRMYGLTEVEILGEGSAPRISLLDALAAADLRAVGVPTHRPDLVEYIDLAIRGGFPAIALAPQTTANRDRWVSSYLEQVLTRDAHSFNTDRDYVKLKRYFEALAAMSAGQPDHQTIYVAAGIDRKTALAYDALLEGLFIAESVPAWDTNRLSRLTHTPKRYVVDPALMSAALGASRETVLADGDLLGRVIDTFVMAQLRPEVALRAPSATVSHLRTKAGREEIDIILELPGQNIIGLEVKATSAPTAGDAKHLRWLRDTIGTRFLAGAVLHTGPDAFQLDDRVFAIPICAFWG